VVHVVGGGVAGLSAAVFLAARGVRPVVHEGAAQAGGRCRSYLDPALGVVIDNGNHLVLSGNTAVEAYLGTIGAEAALTGPETACFPFVDLSTGERWELRPNDGALPWWIFSAGRRVPGTSPADYLQFLKLMKAEPGQRIDEVISPHGRLWRRLTAPFLVAALNTGPEEGSATLAGAVVRETLARGGRACRPRIADPTLAAAFVDPAVAFIEERGGEVRLGKRVRAIGFEGDRAARLTLPDGDLELGARDGVVVAAPPWSAQELIPGLTAPDEFRAIVNAHFRIIPPPGVDSMTGVVGGLAEWVFAFEDRVSVTISAADRLADEDRDALARAVWADVAAVLRMPLDPLPPWQIVKERRATFAATPAQDARRPDAETRWANLWLAGDWTATGLPATLEGAVRSGRRAADLALAAAPV
jgi:squalene-associated FAD-dependent desaturase